MIRQRLTEDDRGAIMLIAVFFALFAVGIVYYLVGIGTTLLFRERLQDAADAAALSAATMHARGMNLLALINIVMAVLLAVLVTLKLLETLAIIGMLLAAALAWVTMGSSLAAVPPLNTLREEMRITYDKVKPHVFRALKALNSTADAVSQAVPASAMALVVADIQSAERPPGVDGVAFGTRLSLPVKDDSFDELCGRAGQVPIQLAKEALSPIPGLSAIIGKLEDPMHSLTSSLSEWFCGDSSNPPPPYSQPVDRLYPGSKLSRACEDAAISGQTGAKAAQICAEAEADASAARPDEVTGACRQSCGLGGPYDARVAEAREQCDPTLPPPPHVYYYQSRDGAVDYEWSGTRWQRGEAQYGTPSAASSEGLPPCGPAHMFPLIAIGYNKVVHTDGTLDPMPVCSSELPPLWPAARRGTVTTVHFTEVTHILGCQRHETKEIPIDTGKQQTADKASTDSEGDAKAPKRLIDELTDETFQLRAVMRAELTTSLTNAALRLALGKAPDPPNPLSHLEELGRFSFAQAEYFYDSAGSRAEWMWSMNWRARLRRFRLPTSSSGGSLADACNQLGDACTSALARIKEFGDAFAH